MHMVATGLGLQNFGLTSGFNIKLAVILNLPRLGLRTVF